MIWDAQDVHHQLIVSVSICSKCHYTWAHMLWFRCTSVTSSVASHEAVINDLGLIVFSHHVVSVSRHHTQQQVSLHQVPRYAYIGVMRI